MLAYTAQTEVDPVLAYTAQTEVDPVLAYTVKTPKRPFSGQRLAVVILKL